MTMTAFEPATWLATLMSLASLVAVLWVLPGCVYLAALTIFSWARRPPRLTRPMQLVCVVPAHNEEHGIAATVHSLLHADYPAHLRSVFVVADNCTDGTARRARAAGAVVVERTDAQLRGKGYALDVGFSHALKDTRVEGVLVVDADTVVSTNLWSAVAAHLERGDAAVQVANVVRNPQAGWRPALQAIGMALMNGVRSLGRERLGLSVGLRGTGMAFARSTLESVPHRAHGVVEDVEYSLALGCAGLRVAYAPEAWIASDAPVTAGAALSQRRRWEGGRAALAQRMGPALLRTAITRRSMLLADLAADLLVPPLSWPALVVLAGALLELLHIARVGHASPAAGLWLFAGGALALYVSRGLLLSGTGWRGLLALAAAPVYVAWKIAVVRPWRAPQDWVRTRRAGPEGPSPSTGRNIIGPVSPDGSSGS